MNSHTELPLLIDLLRLVSLLRQRPLKLLKSGFPGKRDITQLNQRLLSPLPEKSIKRLDRSGYLLFLYEMGYQLDLFFERDNHLYPRLLRAQEFFSTPLAAQHEALVQAYQNMVLWNEVQQIEHLTIRATSTEQTEEVSTTRSVLQARKQLLTKLPVWLAEPLHLSDILQRCQEELLNILHLQPEEGGTYNAPPPVVTPGSDAEDTEDTEEENRTQCYPYVWIKQDKKTRQAELDIDWSLVEGSFFAKVLEQSLRWLNLLDFIESDVEGDPLLSWKGQLEVAPPSNEETMPCLLVQPNMEILAFPNPQRLQVLYEIETFCQPLDGEQILRYRLDKKSFAFAVRLGQTDNDCLSLLEKHSQIPLAPNIYQQLQGWYAQCNRIVISQHGTVIEADTAEELDELLSQFPTHTRPIRLDAEHAFVSAHQLEDIQTLLQQQQPQVFDYQLAPPRSLKISPSLEVEIDRKDTDLFTESFLQKFAELGDSETATRPLYQITQESIQHAQDNGLTFLEIFSFLEERARTFPSTAQLRLESFGDQLGPVYMGNVHILLAPNTETMDRLIYEGGMESYLQRIGPAAAIVKASHQAEARALLESFALPNHTQPKPTKQALFSSKTPLSK